MEYQHAVIHVEKLLAKQVASLDAVVTLAIEQHVKKLTWGNEGTRSLIYLVGIRLLPFHLYSLLLPLGEAKVPETWAIPQFPPR
jgi:hypothetical protein